MSAEIIPFRKAKLTGFIPEDEAPPVQNKLPSVFPAIWPSAEPITDDRSPSELNPDAPNT